MSKKLASKVNLKAVYAEDIALDKNDINRELLKFNDYEILIVSNGGVADKTVAPTAFQLDIIVGNKNVKEKDHLCYFNVYTAYSKHRIGLFEFPMDELTGHLDEEGDLIPPAMPLLFSFVTVPFLEFALQVEKEQKTEDSLKQMLKAAPPIQVKEEEEDEEDDDEEDDDEELHEDPIQEKIPTPNPGLKSLYSYAKIVPDNTPPLPTESEQDTKKNIQEYKELKKTKKVDIHWLNERMKNLHFVAKPVESLFQVIQTVMAKVGKITSPKRCQEFLAFHPTINTVYNEDKHMFSELQTLKHEQENRSFLIESRLGDIAALFKKSSKTVLSIEDSKNLKEEQAKLQIDQKNTLQDIEEINRDIVQQFPYMKHISTLQQYQEYIQSSQFVINPWAIQMLEQEFNIKFILFRKNVTPLEEKCFTVTLEKTMRPDSYILLAAETEGFNQVSLIEYKTKSIFTFHEMPHSVKCLATHQIMTTPFRFIPDFTTFKGCATSTTPEKNINGFVLNSNRIIPVIPKNKWIYYRKLRQTKDWYLILSDDYFVPGPGLALDDHLWPSVTHYVLAGHFADHSVYYNEFTKDVDNGSIVAKSVEIAKMAAQNTGLYRLKNAKKSSNLDNQRSPKGLGASAPMKGYALQTQLIDEQSSFRRKLNCLKLSNVEYVPNHTIVKLVDVDFQKRRYAALKWKFGGILESPEETNGLREIVKTQSKQSESNPIFKNILLWTLDATLLDEKGEEDVLLMQLRKELRGTEVGA